MDTNFAEEILLALIFPRTRNSLSERELSVLAEAAEAQADYMQNNPAEIKSEKIGDLSVTYEGGTSAPRGIAPSAYAILKNAGLILAWV